MADSSYSEIRILKREQRRSLDKRTQTRHAEALAVQLGEQKPFRNAGRIACYLANDGEIETRKLIELAWQHHQQVYLPVLSPTQSSLNFAPYAPDTELCENRFGIAEPVCSSGAWQQADQMDVVLLPLVAFDDTGNRLGMGGGFYDRSLAFLQERDRPSQPFLIGLAHELQLTESIIAQSWDIPLDAIATESRYQEF